VKVNGGAAQSRSFGSLECGNWHRIGQTQITLSGFNAGSTNTVQFMGDGSHAVPDLDWIEVVAAPAANVPAGKTCAAGQTVALKANANGMFASARSDTLNVMAQASVASTWETYDIIDEGGGYVALKSHMNGDYVQADIEYSGNPVRARVTGVGTWEKWTIENKNGLFAFKNLQTGLYMSARLDQANAPLQASASVANAWELFSCQ